MPTPEQKQRIALGVVIAILGTGGIGFYFHIESLIVIALLTTIIFLFAVRSIFRPGIMRSEIRPERFAPALVTLTTLAILVFGLMWLGIIG
jgi:hypothetical protein